MEPGDSPDWLLLPENLTVAIFDFFSPNELLSFRQVCTRWKRLAEASAQTRDKLFLMHCGCEDKSNCCSCPMNLMFSIIPDMFFVHHDRNADGTAYTKMDEDSQIILNGKANGIQCRSFDWKNAQLLARLFPQISHFTVSHYNISAGHLDQILYLLAEWSPTLTAFKFHSNYTLENPDQAVGTASPPTEAYLNSQLTRLFTQLSSLPELKNLTLHYRKGKINSTVADFAFLPRLEELHLDRTSLEANLQAACQRYLAPATVPGTAPQPVLRRFAHYVDQFDATASEFTRFTQYTPEALPLATASTWNSQFAFHGEIQPLIISEMPHFLGRFPSLSCLLLPIDVITRGTTLAPLSRSLSSHNLTVLVLDIVDTNAVEEAAEGAGDLVPVPSVRGITITLLSPDHGRIYPLLDQIPTVFPRLTSLFLLDCRSECSNAPSGAPFSVTVDEPPEFAHFADKLLAAYPNATQPAKYQQVHSFLTIARHIRNTFPTLNRTFKFDDGPPDLILRFNSQQ